MVDARYTLPVGYWGLLQAGFSGNVLGGLPLFFKEVGGRLHSLPWRHHQS